MDEITVKAPATSANLGAGFDICGIALAEPFDLITFRKAGKTVIRNTGRFSALNDPQKSVFGAVIKEMRAKFGFKENFEISINKGIRERGGLGASAAEAVGTAFGLSELLGLDLGKEEIVHYAAFGEEFIDGARHLDNVAPCAYGGFTVTCSDEPVRVKRIEPPEDLECLLILPAREKESTKYARSILPESVPRKDALYNSFCLARLICGFVDGDVGLIMKSLDDKIVEPARAKAGILPNLLELREVGRETGYGVAASGAGPAMIALGRKNNPHKGEFEGKARELFAKIGLELVWTRPGSEGVKAVS